MAREPMPANRSSDSQLFEQLARQAIDETETEIFTESTGAEELENDGDRSLEATETIDGEEADDDGEAKGDDEGDEGTDEEAGEDDGEAEEPDAIEEPPQPRERRGDPEVPLRQTREELRAERERTQRLEAELAALRIARQQAPPAPQEPTVKPDMFADPEGYEKYVLDQATQRAMAQVTAQRLESSLAEAHADHGEEFTFAYNQAKAILDRGPGDAEARALHARINNSPDPGRSLMRWAEPKLAEYREQQAAQEDEQFARMAEARGLDPRMIARMVAKPHPGRLAEREIVDGRSQQSGRRMPPSLNSQTGNGAQMRYDPRGVDGSEGAIFDDAFRS